MFKNKIYKQRRDDLKREVGSGLILMPGNEEASMNYKDNTYHYRQDSSFLYFFGHGQPGLIGIIDVDNGDDYLLGNDAGIGDIIWMGARPTVKELGEQIAVAKTGKLSDADDIIKSARSKGRIVHYLPPYRHEKIIRISDWTGIHHSKIVEQASEELIKAVVKLRSIKSDEEVAEIEKAVDIAREMHIAAMKMAKPGVYEREIAGFIEGISLSYGNPTSYPVILSSRGQILHNHYHGNKLKEGDIVVNDSGSETDLKYSSDITRSFPVGGKFQQRQKEIYEIVLKTLEDSIVAIKPGKPYREIHLEAATIIAGGLKELGIMKGDIDEAVKQGAHALFFPHGLGHMMGMDVHDMEDLGENNVGYGEGYTRSDQFGLAFLRLAKPLKTGHVLTVEPGIYFIPALIDIWKSENKFAQFINYDKVETYKDFGGARVEDDVLVTATGSRILGKRIPKTVEEIEKIMNE